MIVWRYTKLRGAARACEVAVVEEADGVITVVAPATPQDDEGMIQQCPTTEEESTRVVVHRLPARLRHRLYEEAGRCRGEVDRFTVRPSSDALLAVVRGTSALQESEFAAESGDEGGQASGTMQQGIEALLRRMDTQNAQMTAMQGQLTELRAERTRAERPQIHPGREGAGTRRAHFGALPLDATEPRLALPMDPRDEPHLNAEAVRNAAAAGRRDCVPADDGCTLASLVAQQQRVMTALVARVERMPDGGAASCAGGLTIGGTTGQAKLQQFRDAVRREPEAFCQAFDMRMEEMATDPRPTAVMERFPLGRQRTLINFTFFAGKSYELLKEAEAELLAAGLPVPAGLRRAKALAAAAFPACEQAAMDGGRWDMAQSMLLTPDPPFAQLADRKPGTATTETAHAKTADAALVGAVVAHMRDAAAILKAREPAAAGK